MRSIPHSRRTPRGFTLLELIVAIFMVAVVATFSMPSLAGGLRAHNLTAAARTTASYLRAVRATAVARHTRARLVASGDRLATDVLDGGAWMRTGTGVGLDGGITVAAVLPAGGIVFESGGTMNAAGSVRLRNSRGDERVLTVSLLGFVEGSS
jgi:prepilin-type N-terminal cleavage/methylation domain-containing protein